MSHPATTGPAQPLGVGSEWSRLDQPEHVVEFYDDDSSLLDSLTDFIGTGLAAGDTCVVIATKEHRIGLAERLEAAGLDLDASQTSQRYLALDIADTLARIVVDDAPDPERFRDVVGGLIGRAGPGRRLRVFGDMVGLLTSGDNSDGAIRLEELWNGLREEHALQLLCGYPIRRLAGVALARPILEICARHSRVIPAGSYPRHGEPEERLQAIISLQQQAASLQSEMAKRIAVEADLREVKDELAVQAEDLRRLHEMSARPPGVPDVEAGLCEVLRAAMAVHDTSRGLLYLCDPEEPGLVLGVHAGFDDAWLGEVKRVPPAGGACGTAYGERRRVVVEDTETDPLFASDRETARRAGFRASHSTPLFSRSGDLIGVLSVHFARPHRPSERETRLMDLYACIAADTIESARLHRRRQQELEDRRQSLAREHVARAEAETANRIKDDFLATVSHELRTPLNAIMGWSHILRSGKPDEATLARGVEVIERNAQSQAQLIEDILDASRIIIGSLRLRMGPVDLASVITTATEAVRLGAEVKGIGLTVTMDSTARHLSGDASRLQQIVANLLSNAIKFTPAGGRVEIRLTRVDGQAEIKVTDTGEGIDAEFLPFIFDRFRQADATTTRRYGGLGLGLAIVRHLATLHGGTAHVESPGKGYGATFTVRLPLREMDAVAEAGAPDLAGAPKLALRGVRVLLVDDEQDALDMLSLLLAEAGAVVRTATSAAEALALLRWIRPDVLVSDLAMPDEDGYSLIRDLRAIERESGRQTPAVALTAYVRVEDRARAVAAGFDVFVEKPVDPEKLLSVLAAAAERRVTPRTSA